MFRPKIFLRTFGNMLVGKDLNQIFLDEMLNASKGVLAKVRDLWWQNFLTEIENKGHEVTLDALDISMGNGRDELQSLAKQYAIQNGFKEDTASFTQRCNQFLKSNTGKMFERFIGLALSYCLLSTESGYCVLPFRNDMIPHCHNTTPDHYKVNVRLGGGIYTTKIDSDLFCFNPTNPDLDIYLISIKSTLKDRFHNVPFWNLLRLSCISQLIPNMTAQDNNFLSRLKYVAVCSDLALEQPDFTSQEGPRNLLALDASLLDGAYVSASRAVGLGNDTNHIGFERQSPFYPLSFFFNMLTDQ